MSPTLDFSGGDWHMSATWFWSEPETLESCHFTEDETYGIVFERLGTHGVRDLKHARLSRAELARFRLVDARGALRVSGSS